MTLVVVGSSAHPDYSFLLPITALMWRENIGFDFRALLVGRESDWLTIAPKPDNSYSNATKTVLESLKEFKISYTFVTPFDFYSLATISQNIRPHVVVDNSIPDSQWIMPSDADLWPLDPGFYVNHEEDICRAACYYWNGDGFKGKEDVLSKYNSRLPFQSIPMCHVVMKAKDWREIYNISTTESIAENTKKTLDHHFTNFIEHYAGPDRGFAIWCSDQWILTEKLCRQEWFPREVLFIERKGSPPIDRLDRSDWFAWKKAFNPFGWVDAHIHKMPYHTRQWETLLPIIDVLLPDYSDWVRSYREAYLRKDN